MRDPYNSTEPRPFRALPGGLAPLGYRDYLLFWVGFAVSNTGRWIEMTGALWLVSELADTPIQIGGIGIARAVPAILLSPIAGVVADRVDQRRLLLVTQFLSLVLSLLLARVILNGTVELWQIYLQLAIQSCVQPFDLAARQTLFPRLVPRAELARAVTLTLAAARTAKFIGPAVGGLTIALLGEAAPYVLNAISFLVLMAAVIAMHPPPALSAVIRTTFVGELREGLQVIRRTPLISGLFQLEAVFGILSVNDVMITIVAREILGVGPDGLGLLLAAPAFGAVSGVIAFVAVGSTRRMGRLAVVAVAVYSVVMLVLAESTTLWLTFLALAVTGMLDSWVTVTRQGILQMTASAPMRGRIMANVAVVSSGVAPLSQVQSGLLTGLLGASPAIVASAIGLAVVSTAIAGRNRIIWRFESGDDGGADE